ncbi:MAG TPA: M13 family metallopeptidase [Oligoflexus sp.]|uniref:M13 family metallopeptidase n=1 Tax=Oligoflexus sp. TaxID=1971216 RepID=UPI002D310CA9|nr:M13 family metallopeptidase [Oligoflexus sp.]HYX38539.1 M13 family metallopeptidase [Oligoflexus sp.]
MRQSLIFVACSLMAAPILAVTPPQAKASSAIPERREFPVNESINPCDDFYAYACSKAVDSYALRPDRSSHTFAFDDSAERLLEKKKSYLKEIAAQAQKGEKLAPRSQTLATVYNACMEPVASANEEKNRVAETLKRLEGIKDHAAFARFLADERIEARTSFLGIGNLANQNQPDVYDFYFVANAMSLPERSYYESSEVRNAYKKILVHFFQTIGSNKATAEAKAVLDFETAFAKVSPLPAEWRDIWVQKTAISRADLVKKYPHFHFEDFLPQIPETTLIRHFTPDTYAWLQDRLAKEKLDTLKAVYLFESLGSMLDDGYPEFKKAFYAFGVKQLGAPKVRPEREERCTMAVMNSFTKELDAELLPKIFPDFPEEKFVALAEEVRKSIINGINSNQWLSEQGKAGARDKMSKARLQLVKPRNEIEWHFNPEATYSSTEPNGNFEKLAAKLQERSLAELKQKRDSNVWDMGPLTVNAYYSPDDNKFVMPIGILQYPFYDPSLPLEINLGSVGAVIGHELGHGIDDQGAQFDAQGRLKQWMTEADVKNFKLRGQSFEQQFNKIGHNGRLTLGENIGDLTGVTFAYRAAFPEGKGTDDMKRSFFLQYARVWCGVMLPKQKEMRLKTDPHSLGWARVNQQMKNQPEFAKAFQCKPKDAMVLPEKDVVRIW